MKALQITPQSRRSKRTYWTTIWTTERTLVRAFSWKHCRLSSNPSGTRAATSFQPPSSPSNEPSLHQSIFPFWCYSGRNGRPVALTQPPLGFCLIHLRVCPVSYVLDNLSVHERGQRTFSCIFVIDVSVCCGIAQCRLMIVKWRHQGLVTRCWTVIKRHLKKRNGYFMTTVEWRGFRSGKQCERRSSRLMGVSEGKK